MLLTWLGRMLARRSKPLASRPTPRRPPVRPALERLEERRVPAAIRNLPGFTTNNLPANDDGSTAAVGVGFNLNFFGVQTNQVFVNNNGNITFNQPLAAFTPTDLNTNNGGIPIIAAFFADVDTRGTNSGLLTYGTDTLCGQMAFGVDWIGVGYFGSHVDLLNSFQLILVDRSDTGAGNFDIEFNYDQIQWETGDASGGTGGLGGESARVGYSNGTGNAGTFFELPGSGVNGAFIDGGPQALISNSLLAATPGRYHFLVRNGQVVQMIQQQQVNMDVTSGARTFYPFRYVTDQTSLLQHGNLTVINVATPAVPTNTGTTDACLDITGATAGTATNTSFQGPITVVFPQLPPGVRLVNPTGTTASGLPFITVPVSALPRRQPVLRVRIEFQNPTLNAPTTFFVGFPVQVFAGTFDPTTA